MIDKMTWPSPHVTTPFNEASMLDQQDISGARALEKIGLTAGELAAIQRGNAMQLIPRLKA